MRGTLWALSVGWIETINPLHFVPMGTKCRALETTHQFLCFKGKCSNHFAFVFGRYLFPLFWFNLFNVDVNIVVYIHVIENSSQRFHLPNGSVDIDTTKHNSELVAFCKLIHCR